MDDNNITDKVFWGRSDKSKVLDQEIFKNHYDLIKYGCEHRLTYNELKTYAINDSYNFSVMTTKLNIFGLIQFDDSDNLEYNDFFYNFEEESFFNIYSDYYLSYWQEEVSGNRLVKPYLLLLDILRRLKIRGANAYLTLYEFKKVFNEYKEITDDLIEKIISNRQEGLSENENQDLGTLGYSSRGYLKYSKLLNFEFTGEKKKKHYFVEIKESSLIDKKINHLLSSIISRDFYISKNTDLTGKEKIKKDNSDWGKFLNNSNRFKRWFKMVSIIDFIEYCDKNGFNFNEELIRRFILSLETKPFLILTGISGSGKTKIAELYSEYLEEKGRGSQLIIPVGSNWNDNKKLLGFKNPLIEDNDASYQETDLVKFIKIANNNLDKTYVVILDEMNLSYTEKYFADFLSALETRNHEIKLPNGEIIIWSNNLKIIGTINEDETTHTISPKVLDRANVIEMNGLKPSIYIASQIDQNNDIFMNFNSNFDIEEYKNLLDNIYDCLNSNFAFRIINEMTEYINNNKIYAEEKLLHELLDEQIYQKLLPKTHGSKMDLPQRLGSLKLILEETGNPYYNTIEKIDKMLNHVSIHGYASFVNG